MIYRMSDEVCWKMERKLIERSNDICFQINMSCLEKAIIYNTSDLSDAILKWFPAARYGDSFVTPLVETCIVMDRKECEDVLIKHGVIKQKGTLSDTNKMNRLLELRVYNKYP